MENYCKNHPNRLARRRCFQCGGHICSQCQLQVAHHIFCSRRCHLTFLGHYYLLEAKRGIGGILKPIFGRRSPLQKAVGNTALRNFIDLILLAGLITCLILLLSVLERIHRLEEGPSRSAVAVKIEATEKIPPSPSGTALHLSPKPGAMVVTNRVDIHGESEDNHIISLSVDGRLLAVTLPKEGKFSFDGVEAKRGRNKFVVRAMSEDGNSVVLEEIELFYNVPMPRYLASDFTRGSLTEKKIALTFDGGSEDNVAGEILDCLKESGVRCTMFLTGAFIRNFPATVLRMVAEGLEIGNHTWSHPHLTSFEQNRRQDTLPGVTRELLQEELRKTAELFQKITGQEMALYWRAPYGEHNAEIREWAAEIGYRMVGWTLGRNWDESMDTLDWVADRSSAAYHTSEEITEKILNFGNGKENGANGSIVLMHLGSQRQDDFPHRKLAEIINRLRVKGYELVTVSELL